MSKTRVMLVAGLMSAWCSTVFAGEPAWCKGEDFKLSKYSISFRARDNDYRTTIRNIVEFSCSKNPELDPSREEMEKLRGEVSQELFMTDDDWTDAVAYVRARNSRRGVPEIQITEKSLSTLTPMDQYVATKSGFKDSDGRGAGANGDEDYRTDALQDVLTEVGRLGYLEHCTTVPSGFSRKDAQVVMWAQCAEDVQNFDGKKFAAELRSDTAHEPAQRTVLHIRVGAVMEGLKDVAAAKEKLFKDDDAYKRVFEVAAKAREDWRKGVGANKELLALVQTMENGRWFHSRKQFAGCEEKTQKALARAASKIPAKLFKNMYDERDDPFHGFAAKAAPVLLDQPEFYVAAAAYALCQPTTSATGSWLSGTMYIVPGYRGPRTAVHTAIFHQTFELDDTQLKAIATPGVGARPFGAVGNSSSFGGVLKAFKPGSGEDKGKLIANLKKTIIKQEDCVKSHPTNRISHISSSGTVVYESICDKSQIVAHDHTWTPFAVSEQTAKWVKPGQLFSAVSSNGTSDVIAVWPKTTAKQPSLLFGGAVK